MNEKLRQAIAAARNGQSTEAQLLLTQVLKTDPNETQAWFLLSTLVESPEKKIAYLGKVLALNPQHEKAQQMLARMQDGFETEEVEVAEEMVSPPAATAPQEIEPEEPVISPEPVNLTAEETDDTIPDWLADEEAIQPEQTEPVPVVPEPADELEIPDWLQEEVSEPALEAPEDDEAGRSLSLEQEQPEIDPTPTIQKTTISPAESQEKQKIALTRILYSLIAVAVIIFIIMIYFVVASL